jgi:hypothetical protein
VGTEINKGDGTWHVVSRYYLAKRRPAPRVAAWCKRRRLAASCCVRFQVLTAASVKIASSGLLHRAVS